MSTSTIPPSPPQHHRSQSSIALVNHFDFLVTSQIDDKVILTFKHFASNIFVIGELSQYLCPIRNEKSRLTQIKKSKEALENQTKWWLVEASFIMINTIFHKLIEPYTTYGGYNLADIGCTGLGLHMSISLSTVNSSYFNDVSQSHKDLCIALQNQYTELGHYLIEYFLRAELNSRVSKSDAKANMNKIHQVAVDIENNIARIRFALADTFLHPLKPKGHWGWVVSKVTGWFIKRQNHEEIDIVLPLTAAILVIKQKYHSLTTHRTAQSDSNLSSPRESNVPAGLSESTTRHFLDMDAHYNRRKAQIDKEKKEKLRQEFLDRLTAEEDHKDCKERTPLQSLADYRKEILGLKARIDILEKNQNTEALANLSKQVALIEGLIEQKAHAKDIKDAIQTLREEIAGAVSKALAAAEAARVMESPTRGLCRLEEMPPTDRKEKSKTDVSAASVVTEMDEIRMTTLIANANLSMRITLMQSGLLQQIEGLQQQVLDLRVRLFNHEQRLFQQRHYEARDPN